MSGGHYDYLCFKIENMYCGEMADKELEDLLKDFCKVLKDLEWWKSDDIGEDDYKQTVKKFKKKWLKQYNKDLCYEYCPHKELTKFIKDNMERIEKLSK